MADFTYYDSAVRPPEIGDADAHNQVLASNYGEPFELVNFNRVRLNPTIFSVWAPALPSPKRSKDDLSDSILALARERNLTVEEFQPNIKGRLPLASFTDKTTRSTFHLPPERMTGSELVKAHEREQENFRRAKFTPPSAPIVLPAAEQAAA